MASNLCDISLPDIKLPTQEPVQEFTSDTADNSIQNFANFTLPDPSQVPPLSDDVQTSDQRNVVQSEETMGDALQGPERDAKTLGEFKMCQICQIHLNSKVQADMHYAGKLHQKKLRQRAVAESADFTTDEHVSVPVSLDNEVESLTGTESPGLTIRHCDICGLTLTGLSQVKSHLMGARHAKKIRQLEEKKKLEESKEVDGQAVEPQAKPNAFYCQLCKKVCTSQSQLEQHYQGSKHKNATSQARNAPDDGVVVQPADNETMKSSVPSNYVCPLCNVTTNSEQQYLQHCSGTSHKERLRDRSHGGNVRHEPYPIFRGPHSVGRGKFNHRMHNGPNPMPRGNWNGFHRGRGGNFCGARGRGRAMHLLGKEFNRYNHGGRGYPSFGSPGCGGSFDEMQMEGNWNDSPPDY